MAFSAEQSKLKPPGTIAGPGALPPPETPPPMPEPPVPPPRRRAAGRGLALLAMGLLVLLGGAAVVWSYRSAGAAAGGEADDGGAAAARGAAGVDGLLGKAGALVRRLRGTGAPDGGADGGGQQGERASVGGGSAADRGGAQGQAAAAGGGSTASRGESRDDGMMKVEPARPVVWPAVNLSAIVGAGSRGSALLNGELLAVGQQTTDGIALVSVEARAALLEYQGERKRFLVGGSGAAQ